jgi:hypothetical protein
MLPRTKAEIDERYIVVEEMFMTNPPKHAGWALMDSTTRAVIATSVSENALDKAAEILNDVRPGVANYRRPKNMGDGTIRSRSGRIHDKHCLSLTHDGPCDCE